MAGRAFILHGTPVKMHCLQKTAQSCLSKSATHCCLKKHGKRQKKRRQTVLFQKKAKAFHHCSAVIMYAAWFFTWGRTVSTPYRKRWKAALSPPMKSFAEQAVSAMTRLSFFRISVKRSPSFQMMKRTESHIAERLRQSSNFFSEKKCTVSQCLYEFKSSRRSTAFKAFYCVKRNMC